MYSRYLIVFYIAFPWWLMWEIVFSKGSCNDFFICCSTHATVPLGNGSLIFLPLNLGKRVTALTKKYSRSDAASLWSWVKKDHAASALVFGTFILEALSYYVVSPTALRLPGYEETKPQGEATWRHSGQQSLSRSHQVLSSSSSFWVFLAEVPDIVEQKLVTLLCPFQIPDSQNSHS